MHHIVLISSRLMVGILKEELQKIILPQSILSNQQEI